MDGDTSYCPILRFLRQPTEHPIYKQHQIAHRQVREHNLGTLISIERHCQLYKSLSKNCYTVNLSEGKKIYSQQRC